MSSPNRHFDQTKQNVVGLNQGNSFNPFVYGNQVAVIIQGKKPLHPQAAQGVTFEFYKRIYRNKQNTCLILPSEKIRAKNYFPSVCIVSCTVFSLL